MDTEERLAKLEAEVIVLRRYLRAVMSTYPPTQRIVTMFNDTQRQMNQDANSMDEPQAQALRDANSAFAQNQIPKFGLLASPPGT